MKRARPILAWPAGKGIGLIFKRGEVIRKVPEAQIVDALMEEVEKFAAEKKVEQAAAADA